MTGYDMVVLKVSLNRIKLAIGVVVDSPECGGIHVIRMYSGQGWYIRVLIGRWSTRMEMRGDLLWLAWEVKWLNVRLENPPSLANGFSEGDDVRTYDFEIKGASTHPNIPTLSGM